MPNGVPAVTVAPIGVAGIAAKVVRQLVLIEFTLHSLRPVDPELSDAEMVSRPGTKFADTSTGAAVTTSYIILPSHIVSVPTSDDKVGAPAVDTARVANSRVTGSVK